jgi:putative copper resistance protein D
MVLIALSNRYGLVARIGRSRRAASALLAGPVAEIVLALGIVALVAWFGTLEPVAG